jgi:hypothetical protein
VVREVALRGEGGEYQRLGVLLADEREGDDGLVDRKRQVLFEREGNGLPKSPVVAKG